MNVEFMVDPADPEKRILQSSLGISDVTAEPTADQSDAMRAWDDLTRQYQPEAWQWTHDRFQDHVAAPGAEISIREQFGDVTAGFFTIQDFDLSGTADPQRPATIVGFFVEDAEALRND